MNLPPTFQRLFRANSRIRKIASISTYAGKPFHCARVSPDGRFLALGSDDGILEIRMSERNSWRRVSLYTSGTAIRAIVWHPLEPATLFFGAASGNIHKITVIVDGIDITCDGVVSGFVHVLAFSPDGQTLVIAHGSCVSLVKDPFPQQDDLGTLIDLQIPRGDATDDFLDSRIPRGLYFLPESDSLLISWLGGFNFNGYSLVEHTLAWSIPLRPNTLVGSTAISPSGERLAVMNLIDGIDFYSTSRRRFLSTTFFNMSRRNPKVKILVDIFFIDEETVAFGHSDGYMAFATFGVDTITGSFKPNGDGLALPLQTITFGLISNHLNVFGLTSSNTTNDRCITNIYVGQIDTPGATIVSHLSAPVHVEDPRIQQITTGFQFPASVQVTQKQIYLMLTVVAVVLAMICSGERTSADESPHGATVSANGVPNPQTSDLCFCTISGTIMPNA